MAISKGEIYGIHVSGADIYAIRYDGGYKTLEIRMTEGSNSRLILTEESIDALHDLLHSVIKTP